MKRRDTIRECILRRMWQRVGSLQNLKRRLPIVLQKTEHASSFTCFAQGFHHRITAGGLFNRKQISMQNKNVILSEAKDSCIPERQQEPRGAPRFAVFETCDGSIVGKEDFPILRRTGDVPTFTVFELWNFPNAAKEAFPCAPPISYQPQSRKGRQKQAPHINAGNKTNQTPSRFRTPFRKL